MASSRNMVSTIGAQAYPKMGDGTRCPDSKDSIKHIIIDIVYFWVEKVFFFCTKIS